MKLYYIPIMEFPLSNSSPLIRTSDIQNIYVTHIKHNQNTLTEKPDRVLGIRYVNDV